MTPSSATRPKIGCGTTCYPAPSLGIVGGRGRNLRHRGLDAVIRESDQRRRSAFGGRAIGNAVNHDLTLRVVGSRKARKDEVAEDGVRNGEGIGRQQFGSPHVIGRVINPLLQTARDRAVVRHVNDRRRDAADDLRVEEEVVLLEPGRAGGREAGKRRGGSGRQIGEAVERLSLRRIVRVRCAGVGGGTVKHSVTENDAIDIFHAGCAARVVLRRRRSRRAVAGDDAARRSESGRISVECRRGLVTGS